MEAKIITRVNNVDIISTSDEQKLVAIKPICDALGIDYSGQIQKLKENDDLAPTMGLSTTVGADGKKREMLCIPIEYVFGWLFTINPKNVKVEAQAVVRQYRMECYKALYEYFTETQTFLKEKQIEIEKLVDEYQDCQRRFKDAQKLMNEAKTKLNKVMKFTIEEWRFNNRQLIIPFREEEQ